MFKLLTLFSLVVGVFSTNPINYCVNTPECSDTRCWLSTPDETRQENILEIPDFSYYKNKMSAPDVDMVDISTQTDPELYNNPMFVNI